MVHFIMLSGIVFPVTLYFKVFLVHVLHVLTVIITINYA